MIYTLLNCIAYNEISLLGILRQTRIDRGQKRGKNEEVYLALEVAITAVHVII